jgi:polyisoprenoid-binding protein YceI
MKKPHKRNVVALAIFTAFIATAPSARADSIKLKIDPAASKITAAVAEPDKARGDAIGKFTITSGEITGDPSNPSAGGSATMVLDATSYDSGNPFRDDAVFVLLGAKTYPTITFQSTALQNVVMTSTSAGTGTLVGNLTLHGTTRPVSVPFTATRDAADHLTADGKVTFSYADFGMKVPSMMGASAGSDVAVTFHIVAAP